MTTIAPLPTPPSSADPINFNANADAFLGALPQFAADANALAAEVGTNAAAAAGSAADAATQATAAATQATAAAGSANTAALTANFKGAWSSLAGALAKPASVLHQGAYWLLLTNLADVTTSQPGVSADWAPFSPVLPVSFIATDTVAVPFRHYRMTAPCTLTLPALQNGALVMVSKIKIYGGAIAPAGTDKIEGLAEAMTLNDYNSRVALQGTDDASHGWITI